MNAIQHSVTDRINSLHQGIQDKLRTSVADAIEIGKLLSDEKDRLGHGNFLPWVNEVLSLSERTAQNYMRVFDYRNKTANVADLSRAYQIATKAEQEAQKQEQARHEVLIQQREDTGEKPEGWDRSTDYVAKKQRDNSEIRQRMDEKPEERARLSSEELDRILDSSARVVEQEKAHAHLNLSSYADNSNQADMFAAIERYINTFEDTSRQLEATHNLIKKLKEIAASLQRESVAII